MLDGPALGAVLAHERHHAERRDPLRLATGRVLVQALFVLPPLRHLVQRQQALAELGADEAAVITANGDRSALASAMLKFSDASDSDSAGIDAGRIEHLLGDAPQWRFPVALCLGTGANLAVFIALAVLAAEAANGSATLAPPFLSSQPCLAVLAMVPCMAALAAIVYIRSSRSRPLGATRSVGRRTRPDFRRGRSGRAARREG